jgi:hypothetical protein
MLMLACWMSLNIPTTAELLLAKGADVEAKDDVRQFEWGFGVGVEFSKAAPPNGTKQALIDRCWCCCYSLSPMKCAVPTVDARMKGLPSNSVGRSETCSC